MPTTWMPIYWGDYFKNTFHLTTEEHGAYFLLIGYYWQNGKIKNDPAFIRSVTRIKPSRVSSKMIATLRNFFRESDGYLIHDRIEEEIAKALDNKEKQRKRTENATEARWKRNVSVTDSVTFTPSPSPSPSPERKEVREGSLTLFEYCLEVLPEEDRQGFKLKPEESLPKDLGQEWIDRKGVAKEKAMWKAWAKFFNHHLEKPARDDWKSLWINWVINEVVYDVQKKWG